MVNIIRLTESELVELVKKVLEEQSVIGALSDPSNVGLNVSLGEEPYQMGKSGACKKDNPADNKLRQLFTYCNKVSPDSNINKIKKWNDRLYKSMKGLGTNKDFITVLDEIKTVNELSAVWKTFKYDNENLWQWMSSEMKYTWDDVWNHLKKFQSIAKIPICLEYNSSTNS